LIINTVLLLPRFTHDAIFVPYQLYSEMKIKYRLVCFINASDNRTLAFLDSDNSSVVVMMRTDHNFVSTLLPHMRHGQDLGFWDVVFGVWGLGSVIWVWGLVGVGSEFGGLGMGFGMWGLGLGVWGLGFEIWGLMCTAFTVAVDCMLVYYAGSGASLGLLLSGTRAQRRWLGGGGSSGGSSHTRARGNTSLSHDAQCGDDGCSNLTVLGVMCKTATRA